MTRIDYYFGIGLLALLLLLGDYGLRHVAAQSRIASPKVVAAQQFRLVDNAGHTRGTFGSDASGTVRFTMLDGRGQDRIVLAITSTGLAGVAISDARGANGITMNSDSEGPGVYMEGKRGGISITSMDAGPGMLIRQHGATSLALNPKTVAVVDSVGHIRAAYGLDDKGLPFAAMRDRDDHAIWQAP